LDTIHTPFWNWFVELLPMWLAPNLITLIGLVGVIASFLIDTWYIMDFTGEAPKWVYLFAATAVVVYVNLDCIDGKQARRTRSSSPLGQLFDHGCDALSVRLLLDNTQCSFNFPCGWPAALLNMTIMVPWILAHLEEYHTGVLLYGDGLIGILEANYALAVVHSLTYFLGVDFWGWQLNHLLPFHAPWPIEVRYIFFAVFSIGGLSQVVGQIYRVLTFDENNLLHEERGHKELGMTSRLKHLAYLLIMCTLGVWWTSDPTPLWGLCRTASVTYAFAYSLVASQLIVAHMAKEPLLPSAWIYAVMLLGCLNRQFQVVDVRLSALLLMLVAFAGYMHYVVQVINQICDHLGIRVLVIKTAQQ